MKKYPENSGYNREDFVGDIVSIFEESKEAKYPLGSKIRRGRCHVVSGEIEDLFAHYLGKNISAQELVIDQHFISEGLKKGRYPDIMTISQGKVTQFFDLKIDLGHKRDKLAELAENYQKFMNDIRDKKCGFSKGDLCLEVSEKARYTIVVVTDQNISQEMLESELEKLSTLDLPDVDVIFLTKGMHPRSHEFMHSEVVERIDIVHESFNKILSLNY